MIYLQHVGNSKHATGVDKISSVAVHVWCCGKPFNIYSLKLTSIYYVTSTYFKITGKYSNSDWYIFEFH